MKVLFEATFNKDINRIQNKQIAEKLINLISLCNDANLLISLPSLKKLSGYKDYYRIRIGSYRVGIRIIDDTVIFERCLHRKDIYKVYP